VPHTDRLRRLFLLLLLLAVSAAAWFVLWEGPSPDPSPAAAIATAPESRAPAESLRRRAGRAAEPADESWVAVAPELMAAPRETGCRPFRLISDAPEGIDPLRAAVVQAIETVYVERFGVEPVGQPIGAILAFSEWADFSAFVRKQTDLPSGYAAFTRPSRGIVALSIGHDRRRLPQTLAHELAHLLHRRAFGPDPPAWLSEGLADAIADSATERGFTQNPEGSGTGGLAEFLIGAVDGGTVRPFRKLLSISRGAFDREPGQADYSQSALLVRFLLLNPDLSEPFRTYLGRLGIGEPYAADALLSILEFDAAALERRFRAWVRGSTS
jgi:hypothetical protein